jgi:cephalosporin-C deacetylase
MTITKTSHQLILTVCCLLNFTLYGQVKIALNKVKHQFSVGENAQFRISSNAPGNGTFDIFFDPRDPNSSVRRGTFSFSGTRLDTVVNFTLPSAGSVFFRAVQNAVQAEAVVHFDALNIQPFEAEPTDFDAFWNTQKARLAAVPIAPALNQYSQLPNGSRVFFIQLNSVDNRKVHGYLVVPAGSGKFPAVLMIPPFGDGPAIPDPFLMTDFAERCKSIMFYMSVHNTPPNITDPNAYKPNDLTRPEAYYNTSMILAALRAVDYLATRTDFNGNLGVHGNSQGGGLAMSLTGLDRRVTACLAAAPASSEQQGVRFNRASGFPRYVQQGRDLNLDSNVIKRTSKYHDVVYFSKRITVPLMVQTGYRDDVTPSATHFAAFNQYRGKGVVAHYREMGHNYPEEFWSGRYAFFAQHLADFTNPFGFKKSFDLDGGADRTKSGDTINLTATLRLDGIPNSSIPVRWEKVEGTGTVTFSNPTGRATSARFSQSGTYVLRVSADDDYKINDSVEAKYYTMVDYITVTVRGVDTKEVPNVVFSVQPTPSVTTTWVRWQADFKGHSARLLDLNGRVVQSFQLNASQTELQVDLSRCTEGYYFLEMTHENGTKQLVKLAKM